jgi:hypothetical protein
MLALFFEGLKLKGVSYWENDDTITYYQFTVHCTSCSIGRHLTRPTESASSVYKFCTHRFLTVFRQRSHWMKRTTTTKTSKGLTAHAHDLTLTLKMRYCLCLYAYILQCIVFICVLCVCTACSPICPAEVPAFNSFRDLFDVYKFGFFCQHVVNQYFSLCCRLKMRWFSVLSARTGFMDG